MAVNIPTTEPAKIRAGDTLSWKRSLADYPAGTWTLVYTLLNSTAKITITASASGTDHLVAETAATTAAYGAGIYSWTAQVTDGTTLCTVDSGTFEVLADYTALATLDTRSHAKTVLDSIEAVIENRASRTDLEYSLNNRSLKTMKHEELLGLKAHYEAIYKQEQDAERVKNGESPKSRIYGIFR